MRNCSPARHQQIIPEGDGPQFVIQAVPFIGGVEYGTVIPSLTVAMGIRLPEGIEFGWVQM